MNTNTEANTEVQNEVSEVIELTAVEQVQEWADNGDSNKKIRARLTLNDWTDKQISAVIKEAGIGRNTTGFTQKNTLTFLENGVTEYELYEIILSEKAKNEARWIGDRNRIRITLNKIYSRFDSPVAEEAATESQKAAIKALLGK